MSITSTLGSALSGLHAASRAAELVSSNVANAMTEGYARRELELGARRVGDSGQGVQVLGVRRITDPVLTADRRLAGADQGQSGTLAAFHDALVKALGNAEEAGSLTARIAAFDGALITAAAQPSSTAALSAVLNAATALVDGVRSVARTIMDQRTIADRQIAADVATANQQLQQIADLNTEIRSYSSAGRDVSALMDQRARLVDDLSGILPLRSVDRDHGQIALYSASGAVLLDGRPSVLGFTPAAMVTAEMSMASGGLSGLTLNGIPMTPGTGGSLLNGGSLGAQFDIRDRLGPAAQSRLDALARDLVTRLSDPAADPTLAPGDAGLFTDAGGPFVAADETGLSMRIAVNAAADPAQGGVLTRLRDGLNAVAPGPAGNPATLIALREALAAPRIAASGDLNAGQTDFAGLAGEFLALSAGDRAQAETRAAFAATRFSTLKEQELQGGVDTDQEMQSLLVIEQVYAANARMVQTVDEMIQTLLGI